MKTFPLIDPLSMQAVERKFDEWVANRHLRDHQLLELEAKLREAAYFASQMRNGRMNSITQDIYDVIRKVEQSDGAL